MKISDKVAIITGGASGLGQATVQAFAAAGAKVALFDRRLRLNLAAYRTTFKNLQVSSFDAVSTSFITTNAGKARSQGFEGDFIFEIADGFSLNGSLAYLDSTYLDFHGAPCPFDNPTCVPANNNAAGRPLPRAPKWSGTLFADIALPVSGAIDFIANGGMTFRSNTYLEESYNPDAVQRSFAKLDLRLGVRSSDKAWELALVGKNLTNKLTGSHAFNTPLAAGIISKFINPPRTIAVQAKLNF